MSASRYAKNPHIYILIDPIDGQPRYVGKAVDVNRRLTAHCSNWELKSKTHKSHWIKSLKNKGLKPIVEVIDEVREEDWKFWEQHYISLYKSWGFNLTNGTQGGDGSMVGTLNPAKRPEVRALLSFQKQGAKNPRYGVSNSEKQKRAVSKACKGRISPTKGLTKETCVGIKRSSEQHKGNKYALGHKHTLATREKLGRTICQFDLEGKLIKEWKIISDAAKELNIYSVANIIKCAQGKLKKSSGYVWKYKI